MAAWRRTGRIEQAWGERNRVLEMATPATQVEIDAIVRRLDTAIARWQGDEAITQRRQEHETLKLQVATLTAEVSERRTWEFANDEDRWWHAQLATLVGDLEAFSDPRSGLVGDTVAEPFGWGVSKRYEFARTIRERSIEGAPARQRWEKAITAIAASSEYGGLKLSPQLGLLPIGADPDSRLWEFAHLQSGAEAVRGADGRLVIEPETGLVLVLIPGGPFLMGAQAEEPGSSNYDPQAAGLDGPVHAVRLSAYFLSKYEMTDGQWSRIAARNPSWNVFVARHGVAPIESVSWFECAEIMERTALKLPSEAQWEYACRAGTSTVWCTGDERDSLIGFVNLADRSAAKAGLSWPNIQNWLEDGFIVHAAVDTFAANDFGLHQMHGNVQEWCLDPLDHLFYFDGPSLDPVAPTGTSGNRIVRGGHYSSNSALARSAARSEVRAETTFPYTGVRPARSVDP
jgi:formylglycine-generating enzyme required for sulfatase activity